MEHMFEAPHGSSAPDDYRSSITSEDSSGASLADSLDPILDWIPVTGSSRIVAEAYDRETATIFVRFQDGVEWSYWACSLAVWHEFTRPEQSRGRFIRDVLDTKPNGPSRIGRVVHTRGEAIERGKS
jgi:hypothetical protein